MIDLKSAFNKSKKSYRIVYANSDRRNGVNIVAETPPQMRIIYLNEYTATGGMCNRKYFLAFPYLQFIIQSEILGVSCTNKPMKLKNNKLIGYVPPLPNISDSFIVCGIDSEFGYYHNDVEKTIEEAISIFWLSGFNHDGEMYPGSSVRRKKIGTFRTWEEKSKQNPNFILDVDWNKKRNILELDFYNEEF